MLEELDLSHEAVPVLARARDALASDVEATVSADDVGAIRTIDVSNEAPPRSYVAISYAMLLAERYVTRGLNVGHEVVINAARTAANERPRPDSGPLGRVRLAFQHRVSASRPLIDQAFRWGARSLNA